MGLGKSWTIRRFVEEVAGGLGLVNATPAVTEVAVSTFTDNDNTDRIKTPQELALALHSESSTTRGVYETATQFLERMRLKRFKRGAKNVARDANERMVTVFHSPGTLMRGKPRPTMPTKGGELNAIDFKAGKQLLFSDGSFRRPGRRHLVMTMGDGTKHTLSGRQLRNLRKRLRRNAKQAQQVVALPEIDTIP